MRHKLVLAAAIGASLKLGLHQSSNQQKSPETRGRRYLIATYLISHADNLARFQGIRRLGHSIVHQGASVMPVRGMHITRDKWATRTAVSGHAALKG